MDRECRRTPYASFGLEPQIAVSTTVSFARSKRGCTRAFSSSSARTLHSGTPVEANRLRMWVLPRILHAGALRAVHADMCARAIALARIFLLMRTHSYARRRRPTAPPVVE